MMIDSTGPLRQFLSCAKVGQTFTADELENAGEPWLLDRVNVSMTLALHLNLSSTAFTMPSLLSAYKLCTTIENIAIRNGVHVHYQNHCLNPGHFTMILIRRK